MLLLLALLQNKPPLDDKFVAVVTEETWKREIARKKTGFIFFHAPYLRVSDMGYLNFVKVARKYSNETNFFVVPANRGEKVAREFRIGGFPSLYFVAKDGKPSEMIGPASRDNIDRFISSNLKPQVRQMTEIPSEPCADDFDGLSILFVFGDDKTNFGRKALEFAASKDFDARQFADPNIAKQFGVRFPSVVLFRHTDQKRFDFIDDPNKIDDWFTSLPPSIYETLKYPALFSPDGVEKRSFIQYDDNSLLIETSKRFSDIRLFEASTQKHRSLLKFLGLESRGICVVANFSTIRAAPCNSVEEIEKFNVGEPRRIDPILYGSFCSMTEFALNELLKNEPVFVLFVRKGDQRSWEMELDLQVVAETVASLGYSLRFTEYDMKGPIKIFDGKIPQKIPSLYYIPELDTSKAQVYDGRKDSDSILDWVKSLAKSKTEEEEDLQSSL